MSLAERLTIAMFEQHRLVAMRIVARRLGSLDAAEDVVQDALMKVMQLPNDQVINNPGAFLVKVSLNLANDRLRSGLARQKREEAWTAAHAGDDGSLEASPRPSAEDSLLAQEKLKAVLAHLDELSPSVRDAFLLFRADGLSQKEVAARLGLSPSTVEKHVAKAMRHLMDRRLQDFIEDHGEPERPLSEKATKS